MRVGFGLRSTQVTQLISLATVSPLRESAHRVTERVYTNSYSDKIIYESASSSYDELQFE
jgi:hypothetical protein